MARDGLSRLAGVALTLLTLTAVSADDRIANTLAVQTALQQGRAHLIRSDFQSAVRVLESQITRVDGNPQYLTALRDAYRGLVKDLKRARRDDDAAIYTRRLEILDPGAPLDFPTAKARPEVKPPARPMPPRKDEKPPEKKPLVARGEMSDEGRRPATYAPADVFADSNTRRAHEAHGYLDQAEKLFLAEQYDKAAELFAKTHATAPEVMGGAQERWAYCQLSLVVKRLNTTERPIAREEWPALEAQVRSATTMWPKVEKFGKSLLVTIHDRRTGTAAQSRPTAAQPVPGPAPAVTVKHSRDPCANSALAETANFRIFHNLDQAKAEEVARIVETTRAAMQRKWFGKVEEDWSPRCDVYLFPDADSYSRQTGVRASAPGHARVVRASPQSERIVERKLFMRLDAPDMLKTVLPHETTHVVLGGRFGAFNVPRWADEGMAVLTEPREQIERHLRTLPAHRAEQSLFQVRGLMELNDYPHPRQIGAFYAQSVSLVEFLSGLKGSQVFAQFLADGLRGGCEPALRKHFGLQGYHDLQARWQAHAFREGPGAGVAQGDN